MKSRRFIALLSVTALLSACGGGGGGGGGGTGPIAGGPGVTPAPTPSPSPAGPCSLRSRQDWAAAQLREWYLFPETLPASPNPSAYSTVDDYIDALTATARAQGRDRYFTYLTSIAEENAYYSSGETAGFGIRLMFDPANRLVISESFEGAPALAAGIDRGTEIVAIGTSESNLRTVQQIVAAEGSQGIINALGPDTAGTRRTLQIRNNGVLSTVSVAKGDFELTPVSSRYGAKVIDYQGLRVGYVNLRTFISPADPALRQAFAQFRAQGVANVIVDLRYNGGGLVSIASLLGDLLGGARSTSDVQHYTVFRPEKASENETRLYQPQSQSVSPVRIAFIGTEGSASASELTINSTLPYFGSNVALVGTDTYGKPVGQIAIDRSQCDDRLRVIAFATQNAQRQGDYYDGLASKMTTTCRAADDVTHPMGDPAESSTLQALEFLSGRTCTPISAAAGQRMLAVQPRGELLMADRPNTAQREVPGLF